MSSVSSQPISEQRTLGTGMVGGREVLVDEKGRALYLFTKDSAGVSNCADDCLAKWPAFSGPITAAAGIDSAKIASIARADGTNQVAYAGKPLYYFAADTEPGDTRGQGAMNAWYLIGPDGEAVR
ncbi:hypothetical protein AB0L63_27370 [Nocardia sp. NPDC051990]|uniref:COG4315 family predicted lipoprotein n=1 Tax=Nocardia sp. NPDC051990 TaxID=3155285 RepID=UPI0034371C80